jgi:hypothetical protein
MPKYPKAAYRPNFNFKKVPWCEFIIVCKTEKDRKQIRAAMQYFHDMKETDTGFIVVNQLVHNYLHDDASDAHTDVIVDAPLYKRLKPRKNVKLTKR